MTRIPSLLLIVCAVICIWPDSIDASSSSSPSKNGGFGERMSSAAETRTSPSHATTRSRHGNPSPVARGETRASQRTRTERGSEEEGGVGGGRGDRIRRDSDDPSSESREESDDEEGSTGSFSSSVSSPAEFAAVAAAGMAGTRAGSIGCFLREAVRSSTGPMLRSAAFGARLAVAGYFAWISWTAAKEVWEELSDELSSSEKGGRGGSGSASDDGREEQDLPYADDEAIDEVAAWKDSDDEGGEEAEDRDGSGSECEADDSPISRRTRRRRPLRDKSSSSSPRMSAARDLAARLHSAGIPYASEAIEGGGGGRATVEDVLRSLTRSEGNVLSQTLLSPLDGGFDVGGGSADAVAESATEAWNAIGGLVEAKESLLDLAFPLLPPSHAASLPAEDGNNVNVEHDADGMYYGGLLSNPPGFMLYGPPGCGKTLLVRALAATVGARFLVVSPSCLLRKYVGETNLNVRALFSAARKVAPCVLFVDELDGLFRERGGEDHDVGRDLKTEFLQLWDGIRNRPDGGGTGGSVLVIGATNRPFDVDSAFLRRMPRRVFVGLPDYDARVAVLRSVLRRVPLDANFDVALVARETEAYSPSDIKEVLRAAALFPLREARASAVSASRTDGGGGGDLGIPLKMPSLRSLTTTDVLRALERVKPTHFSERYRRALMEYVRSSGGVTDGRVDSPHGGGDPRSNDGDYNSPPSRNDVGGESGSFFYGDAGTFIGDNDRRENWSESESSYTEDLSDSDDLDEL